MKKAITAVTAIFVLGFFAASAYAWGGSGKGAGAGMRGPGQGRNNPPAVSQEDMNAFFKETQVLRISLDADRTELRALMAGTNPDPKRARALSENISKTRNQIRAKAQQYKIACPMAGQGYGRGGGNGGKGGKGGGRRCNQAARCW